MPRAIQSRGHSLVLSCVSHCQRLLRGVRFPRVVLLFYGVEFAHGSVSIEFEITSSTL